MDFTGKSAHYRIGYSHGLHAAVAVIASGDPRGTLIPKDFDEKRDPEADYALGHIDGIEHGVEIMGRYERQRRPPAFGG